MVEINISSPSPIDFDSELARILIDSVVPLVKTISLEEFALIN
jgi:hypothetical protein